MSSIDHSDNEAEIHQHLLWAYGAFLRLGWLPQWVGPVRLVGTSRLIRKKPVDQLIVESDGTGVGFLCSLPDGRKGTAGMQRDTETAFRAAWDEVRQSATPAELDTWAAALRDLEVVTNHAIEASRAEEAAMADATPYAAQGHRVTYGLIGANVLVFLLMTFTGANLFAPSGEDLIRWGANYLPYTLGGEPWRLITACFVHIGLLHLAFNMFALFQQGMFLESVLGRTRLLAAYIATGLFASLTSLWWHRNDMVVSAGASGAIFGLFGLFGALLTSKLLPDSVRKQLLRSIGGVIVINLLYGLKAGIDNSAHVGGLLSGFVIGQLFLPGLKKKQRGDARISTAIVLAAIAACGVYVALHPNDRLKFEAALERYPAFETRGLQPFGHDTTVVALIGELDAVQAQWDSARILLERTKGLRLSEADAHRRALLEQYTELRARQNRLARRQLLGEEGAVDSLKTLDTAINNLLQQVNEKQ